MLFIVSQLGLGIGHRGHQGTFLGMLLHIAVPCRQQLLCSERLGSARHGSHCLRRLGRGSGVGDIDHNARRVAHRTSHRANCRGRGGRRCGMRSLRSGRHGLCRRLGCGRTRLRLRRGGLLGLSRGCLLRPCGRRHNLLHGLRGRLLGLRRDHYLAQLDQCEFHQQLLAAGIAVIQVTGVAQVQGTVIKRGCQFGALLAVALGDLVIHLQQFACLGRGGDHQVAQVLCQTVNKKLRVEALVADFLIDEQGLHHVTGQEGVHKPEVVVIVQHVQVVERALVGDMPLGRGGHLVKDG